MCYMPFEINNNLIENYQVEDTYLLTKDFKAIN